MSADLAEAARALYQPGVNGHGITSVARQLGISPTSVRRYVNPTYATRMRHLSNEAKRRRTGICRECGGETRYNGRTVNGPSTLCSACLHRLQHEAKLWTREAVLTAIAEWAHEHGKPPSSLDWLHADPEQRWPNRASVYADPNAPFQTWGDAIEAAGFPRPRILHHGRKGELVWTKERTLEAIRVWAAEHGRAPRVSDWERRAEDRPTANWVQQLFGRWNIAIARTGFTPQPRKGWPKPKSEEAP